MAAIASSRLYRLLSPLSPPLAWLLWPPLTALHPAIPAFHAASLSKLFLLHAWRTSKWRLSSFKEVEPELSCIVVFPLILLACLRFT